MFIFTSSVVKQPFPMKASCHLISISLSFSCHLSVRLSVYSSLFLCVCLPFFLSRLPTFSGLPLSVQLLRLSVRPSACLSVFLCLLLHSLLVNYTCKYKLSSLLVQRSKPVKKDLEHMLCNI